VAQDAGADSAGHRRRLGEYGRASQFGDAASGETPATRIRMIPSGRGLEAGNERSEAEVAGASQHGDGQHVRPLGQRRELVGVDDDAACIS
jgi:hypothetical protein